MSLLLKHPQSLTLIIPLPPPEPLLQSDIQAGLTDPKNRFHRLLQPLAAGCSRMDSLGTGETTGWHATFVELLNTAQPAKWYMTGYSGGNLKEDTGYATLTRAVALVRTLDPRLGLGNLSRFSGLNGDPLRMRIEGFMAQTIDSGKYAQPWGKLGLALMGLVSTAEAQRKYLQNVNNWSGEMAQFDQDKSQLTISSKLEDILIAQGYVEVAERVIREKVVEIFKDHLPAGALDEESDRYLLAETIMTMFSSLIYVTYGGRGCINSNTLSGKRERVFTLLDKGEIATAAQTVKDMVERYPQSYVSGGEWYNANQSTQISRADRIVATMNRWIDKFPQSQTD